MATIENETIGYDTVEEILVDKYEETHPKMEHHPTPEEEGKQAALAVSRLVNSFSNKGAKTFVDTMLREHRTLQQSFMGEIVIPFIKKVASADDYCFDARNRAMRDVCVKLNKVLEEDSIDSLPCI